MGNKKNIGLDQLDFKLVLAFTNAYERLYERGLITEKQLEMILTLLDKYQNYTLAEFEEKLQRIFPD